MGDKERGKKDLREGEKDLSYCFTPQMARSLSLSESPTWVQTTKRLGHLLMLPLLNYQIAECKVEQLGRKLSPLLDVGAAGISLCAIPQH